MKIRVLEFSAKYITSEKASETGILVLCVIIGASLVALPVNFPSAKCAQVILAHRDFVVDNFWLRDSLWRMLEHWFRKTNWIEELKQVVMLPAGVEFLNNHFPIALLQAKSSSFWDNLYTVWPQINGVDLTGFMELVRISCENISDVLALASFGSEFGILYEYYYKICID